jgi:hypothetical protein
VKQQFKLIFHPDAGRGGDEALDAGDDRIQHDAQIDECQAHVVIASATGTGIVVSSHNPFLYNGLWLGPAPCATSVPGRPSILFISNDINLIAIDGCVKHHLMRSLSHDYSSTIPNGPCRPELVTQ